MSLKIFISADDLLLDSFRLARRILDSGWRPDALVALWRGGTPVGVAVHEFLAYNGVDTCHMALKCASYTGIASRGEVRFEYADPALDSIRSGQRVLVVDDIFDSGCTAAAVLGRLAGVRADVRIATVFWKPANNATAHTPDYYLHVTEDWVVFPHELMGLTPAEIARKSPVLRDLLAGSKTGRAAGSRTSV